MDISQMQERIARFADERDWDQFHTPRNLLLALMGELGELAELLQWKTDEQVREALQESAGREAIEEEVADVAIYLLRLAQVMDIDIPTAVEAKIALNESKYPADRVRGSAKKYDEY
ncbi:nucleotide pyrophosphohydrolase [Demequina sp. NBRC 110054]|uniref:nucleotide pyrophosphohydrolase n=1 Tax=Demequina sp. NBRC 110054 TaxID=1570343 RepID=UPI00190E9E35|nr:nucleotide pyrophosphohydrolase [Demequina sp. NBRC 110054]